MRRERRDDDHGQALVEFALVLPVTVLLIVGLFDASRAVWLTTTLAHATREATRYAIVHGSQSASPVGPGSATYTAPDQDTAVAAVVRQYATGVASLTIASTWPDGDSRRGSRVSVSATAPFSPILSEALLGGGLRFTLRGSSTLVIHQ